MAKLIQLKSFVYKIGDVYRAECPETGITSQGATLEEAKLKLQEETEQYLSQHPLTRGWQLVFPLTSPKE